MSDTFYLVCPETKQRLWIGQSGDADGFFMYTGDRKVMNLLEAFLNETRGKALVVKLNNGVEGDEILFYTEFEGEEEEVAIPKLPCSDLYDDLLQQVERGKEKGYHPRDLP